MINCIQVPDGNGFICTMCGWMYHKRGQHNCPKSPEGRAGKLIALPYEIAAKYESTMNWQRYYPRATDDLKRILETCLDCPDHNGNTCNERFIDCKQKAYATWLKRLACVGFRECPRWK